jgi:MFS family permease
MKTPGTHPIRRFFFGDQTPLPLEVLTLRSYLIGMIFQGIWWSGYLLFPFVLAKSLHGSGGLITVAVTMDTAGMLLALYWGHLMARGGRRRWLFWGGVGGRLVMILALFVSSAVQFVLLLAVVYFFTSLMYPAQNGIFQANFHPTRQGRFFGYGALVQHVTAATVSLVIGRILDADPQYFRLLYPLVGLAGFMYLLILSLVPRPAADESAEAQVDRLSIFKLPPLPTGDLSPRRVLHALVEPFRDAVRTYRSDRGFFWYEINFMLYGMAFMMLTPVVPIYFTESLNLSYEQISAARVLIASLGVAALGPLMGRFMDRFHPVRLCILSFAVVAFYPVALAVADLQSVFAPVIMAYLAFAIYSMGMSGINVTWNVGSIAFAPPGQGGYYQGIHVAMVGIRGVIGPLTGFIVLRLLGYQEVFWAAAGFFMSAAISSVLLWKWLTRHKKTADS